jgi:hypothetical protein
VVGQPADRISTSVSALEATQTFRAELPAGTTQVELPLRLPGLAELGGAAVAVRDGAIVLDEPLAHPTVLTITTGPTAVDRGGAAWSGPLTIRTVAAPLALGSWRDLGLRSWSGAVRYSRHVEMPSGSGPVVLDLGRVRGSVDVAVDGQHVDSAFCAPYRFELGFLTGRVRLEVTVYNTLGPFFDESTPTTWVFPSQLHSGLYGPVSLRRVPSVVA